MDIDVGGNIYHTQKGVKIELGSASDHVVIYVDSNDFDAAKETIKRSIRLLNFAKECKSGMLPLDKVEV
jgi:acid phosphatase class B